MLSAMSRERIVAWCLPLVCAALLLNRAAHAQALPPPFHVLALAEKGGIHKPFVDAARQWLAAEAARDNFTIDYLEATDTIDEKLLAHYQLFLQLNYPPYAWKPAAMAAFTAYIEEGRGGWIGLHHATLLGEFDGYPMWPWFSTFLGGIRWKQYIATFATGTVHVEDAAHPVMQGMGARFPIADEEWYTYDRSPRPNVHVLASVDEKSYVPASAVSMGDHPVVWTNEHVKARNVYIFMGHHPELFANPAYTRLLHNAHPLGGGPMRRLCPALLLCCGVAGCGVALHGQAAPKSFRVLGLYSEHVEPDHVAFAHEANAFYAAAAVRDNFTYEASTDWDLLSTASLDRYQVVIWLDDAPHTAAQQAGFRRYMEHGGGWLGTHVAAYNDADTHWPWFVQFLGGAIFYGNNWPPLPATLVVDDAAHPVTRGLPASFVSPANEWYLWQPSPRANPDVRVLLTLSLASYPLGWKDVLRGGDLPVVWTDTRYRMLYVNMGHGDQIFTNPVQNRLFENAVVWLGRGTHPQAIP